MHQLKTTWSLVSITHAALHQTRAKQLCLCVYLPSCSASVFCMYPGSMENNTSTQTFATDVSESFLCFAAFLVACAYSNQGSQPARLKVSKPFDPNAAVFEARYGICLLMRVRNVLKRGPACACCWGRGRIVAEAVWALFRRFESLACLFPFCLWESYGGRIRIWTASWTLKTLSLSRQLLTSTEWRYIWTIFNYSGYYILGFAGFHFWFLQQITLDMNLILSVMCSLGSLLEV